MMTTPTVVTAAVVTAAMPRQRCAGKRKSRDKGGCDCNFTHHSIALQFVTRSSRRLPNDGAGIPPIDRVAEPTL
jgi:hypothetical protein